MIECLDSFLYTTQVHVYVQVTYPIPRVLAMRLYTNGCNPCTQQHIRTVVRSIATRHFQSFLSSILSNFTLIGRTVETLKPDFTFLVSEVHLNPPALQRLKRHGSQEHDISKAVTSDNTIGTHKDACDLAHLTNREPRLQHM